MLQKLNIGDEKVVAFRWEGAFDEKGIKHPWYSSYPNYKCAQK